MKIALTELPASLNKTLAPVYVVASNEVLLTEEASQAIRSAALKQGFTERLSIATDTPDWIEKLYQTTQHASLFSTKQLIELDISQVKFTAKTSALFQECISASNHLFLIRMQKLETKLEQSAWFKLLNQKGIILSIWPITPLQLPQWIIKRAEQKGLQLTPRAAELLAKSCEGNIVAAAQELEKLALFNQGQQTVIDDKIILSLIYDHADFTIYTLTESILLGNATRTVRILQHLQAEGIEPTLVLWAVTTELRLIHTLMQQQRQGSSLASLYQTHRVWEKRQGPITAFLKKATLDHIYTALLMGAEIDRMIKGAESGDVWDKFSEWAVRLY